METEKIMMNCKRKTIPKRCVKAVGGRRSAYYQLPVEWCIGCRHEIKLEVYDANNRSCMPKMWGTDSDDRG